MFSSSRLCELEMRSIDGMSRLQLIEAIREHQDCLPGDLQERIESEATDRLRLFLFAARLLHVLRQLPCLQREG